MEENEAKKLYSDTFIRNLVHGFPKSLSDEKRNLETRTTKLWGIMLKGEQT